MIKINFSKNIDQLSNLSAAKLKLQIIKDLEKFDLTDDIEVEIIFVSKVKIKKLNNQYRNINRPTDVLSFPQSQFSDVKKNILGSVVICPKVVENENEDINEVIKHGLLHLLGYDHENNQKEWEKAAKKISCNL